MPRLQLSYAPIDMRANRPVIVISFVLGVIAAWLIGQTRAHLLPANAPLSVVGRYDTTAARNTTVGYVLVVLDLDGTGQLLHQPFHWYAVSPDLVLAEFDVTNKITKGLSTLEITGNGGRPCVIFTRPPSSDCELAMIGRYEGSHRIRLLKLSKTN